MGAATSETTTIHATAAGPIEAALLGRGPAVVLVHGTLGNWRQLQATARDLAESHTVVLVSRPGYGTTPLESGRTVAQQASLYASLLDRLGLERAALVGASAGAPSCVAFAAKFPTRCSALVLCGALAPRLASTRGMWATEIPGVVALWAAVEGLRRAAAARDPQRVVSYLRPQLSGLEREHALDPSVGADLVDFVRWTAEGSSGLAGLRNDIRTIRAAHRFKPEVDGVTSRCLLLHGDRDRFVPSSHSEFYRSVIPGATLELVPGGAHLFVQVFRRAISRRIAAYLS